MLLWVGDISHLPDPASVETEVELGMCCHEWGKAKDSVNISVVVEEDYG